LKKAKLKTLEDPRSTCKPVQIERDTAKTARYKALVEKLNAEHADFEVRGRKVGAMMKATLEAKEKLAIGKSAPEIIGKDVDGKEMKLSDYKGQDRCPRFLG
jgi:hypothetical protein